MLVCLGFIHTLEIVASILSDVVNKLRLCGTKYEMIKSNTPDNVMKSIDAQSVSMTSIPTTTPLAHCRYFSGYPTLYARGHIEKSHLSKTVVQITNCKNTAMKKVIIVLGGERVVTITRAWEFTGAK